MRIQSAEIWVVGYFDFLSILSSTTIAVIPTMSVPAANSSNCCNVKRPMNMEIYPLRRTFRPQLLVASPEGNQILYAPEPICDASGHCRTHAKCTTDFDEVRRNQMSGPRPRQTVGR
jgi:hypothetical protein